jgi:glycosyltransferase involved in cell wall biosynthesis
VLPFKSIFWHVLGAPLALPGPRSIRVAKLLFVVTEDWYFVSHRLELAVAARDAGYEVAVATRFQSHRVIIEAAGIRAIPFTLSRRVGNPLTEVLGLVQLYKREKPDLVHHVALKPVMYGAAAARITGVPAWINSIAGLGWMARPKRGVARGGSPFLYKVLSRVVDQGASLTIVQNPDDARLLLRAGVREERLVLIRGAGVDTIEFTPPLEPVQGKLVVMLVSRMLWDKGPGDFVEAAKLLHASGIEARFVLVGDVDASNPNSVPEKTLRSWDGNDGVEWWGLRNDIADCYRQAHIACLPTFYGEGIPKSLLEAAACGLPVVTTDMPGCREVVHDGINGLLVPPREVAALAEALGRLIADASLRKQMGRQGRLRAEREFASSIIINQTLDAYASALSPRPLVSK